MIVLRSIEKVLWRCELVLVYTSVVATVAIMCLTSADALSRYLLNRPITGAYEITEKYLMVAAIFLGLSYAYRGGLFIRVTFLVDRQGIVRFIHPGGQYVKGDKGYAAIKAKIEELLDEK